MNSMIGKKGLIIYQDGDLDIGCFGEIIDIDEIFFSIKTDENVLLIPKNKISKVKIRNGGNDERVEK